MLWDDERSGDKDVYAYDLIRSKEKKITDNVEDQYLPTISKKNNWAAYIEGQDETGMIYACDLQKNNCSPISDDSLKRESLSTDGRYFPWFEMYAQDKFQLQVYDRDLGKYIFDPQDVFPPANISDGKLVYLSRERGNGQVIVTPFSFVTLFSHR